MHRIIKSIIGRSKKIANYPLHTFECEIFHAMVDQKCLYPPIFIIGPPRSGSTLLYQAMTDYFDLAYLTNLHCNFFGAPSFIEKLVHPIKWHKPSDYQSKYGRTNGLTAPSECGEFWYRFFPRKPPYVFKDDVSTKQLNQVRSVIINLGESFKKPILFKNVYNSVRLLPLTQALPEALFIVIRRNEIDNAHSILASRWKVLGDYSKWWSLELPETESLKKLPAHQQAIEQVRHTYQLIENHKKQIGKDRFYNVSYEQFCEDPYKTMNNIEGFFAHHGLEVTRRGYIPEKFSVSRKNKIEPDLYKKLVNYARAE